MKVLRPFEGLIFARHLTKLKLVLLLSFSTLLLLQLFIGFENFDDYLIVFIFVLFLNDLHYKITHPNIIVFHDERSKRLKMSAVFLVLLILPFVIDSLNITETTRVVIYKLGIVLWAQVFFLDTYLLYKQTHSRKWLVFANFAAFIIVLGAFIN